MNASAPSSTEAVFTESLNFKVSVSVKKRLVEQAGRLEMTQAGISRLALALGLEAIERLRAEIGEGPTAAVRNR
jgi:hypothetical protein